MVVSWRSFAPKKSAFSKSRVGRNPQQHLITPSHKQRPYVFPKDQRFFTKHLTPPHTLTHTHTRANESHDPPGAPELSRLQLCTTHERTKRDVPITSPQIPDLSQPRPPPPEPPHSHTARTPYTSFIRRYESALYNRLDPAFHLLPFNTPEESKPPPPHPKKHISFPLPENKKSALSAGLTNSANGHQLAAVAVRRLTARDIPAHAPLASRHKLSFLNSYR